MRRNDTDPIPEASEVLLTMLFSGPGKFSCPSIVKITQGKTKRCPNGTQIAEKNDVSTLERSAVPPAAYQGLLILIGDYLPHLLAS